MRSWKTPALLATVGLCGLGSLFAQDPVLQSVTEPTPINSSSSLISPLPAADVPVSGSSDVEVIAPAPISFEEPAMQPAAEQQVHEAAPVSGEMPVSSGTLEFQSAPTVIHESAPVSEYVPSPQSTCDCQGSVPSYGGTAFDGPVMGPSYGSGIPPVNHGPIYTMGSGSGVASGVLTPISNSGGLHTRYPYYSYRAPWYYQGPPSQNVTIVW